MKRRWFLVGAGVGFVLGSKTGTGPYEHLQTKVRSVTAQPEVEDVTAKVKAAAHDQVDEVANRVAQHVPATNTGSR